MNCQRFYSLQFWGFSKGVSILKSVMSNGKHGKDNQFPMLPPPYLRAIHSPLSQNLKLLWQSFFDKERFAFSLNVFPSRTLKIVYLIRLRSQFFNTLEWLSFLINEKKTKDKKVIKFFKADNNNMV